jgi:hypothetical protein
MGLHAAQKVSKYADTLQQKVSAYTKLSGELNGMNARQTYVHLSAPFASLAVSCGHRRCSFAWLGLSIISGGGWSVRGNTHTSLRLPVQRQLDEC